jgi:hypothetical protein
MGVTTSAALAFLDEELNDHRDGMHLDDPERELFDAVLADNYQEGYQKLSNTGFCGSPSNCY